MRPRDFIRMGMVLTVFIALYIAINPPQQAWKEARKLRNIFEYLKEDENVQETTATHYKCGLREECPVDHFAFYIKSGTANIIGPKICFEDQVIMSNAKNNIGPGMNIVLINEYEDLLHFLKDIQPGTIALAATFDEPETQLTRAVRDVFVKLGSTMIMSVEFRDGWVFAGAAGMAEKNHFEKHEKYDVEKNVYNGWPEVLELSGCFPKML